MNFLQLMNQNIIFSSSMILKDLINFFPSTIFLVQDII